LRSFPLPLLALAWLLTWAPPAAAEVTPTGDALQAVLQRLAWTRYRVGVEFVVQRAGKSPLAKGIEVIVQDEPSGQKLLMQFTHPANMRGTAFLALTDRAKGDDEYHLYLRTLRRVKRVPNCTENFMLRDFLSLYFLKPRPELWRFQAIGAGSEPGEAGFTVVEGTPVSPHTIELTGYGKLRHVVDPAQGLIVRTEFFDAGGALVRRQRVLEWREQDGAPWPWKFETDDLREGVKATVLTRELEVSPTLSDDTFTVRYLKRL
jgi:hypothetical protein